MPSEMPHKHAQFPAAGQPHVCLLDPLFRVYIEIVLLALGEEGAEVVHKPGLQQRGAGQGSAAAGFEWLARAGLAGASKADGRPWADKKKREAERSAWVACAARAAQAIVTLTLCQPLAQRPARTCGSTSCSICAAVSTSMIVWPGSCSVPGDVGKIPFTRAHAPGRRGSRAAWTHHPRALQTSAVRPSQGLGSSHACMRPAP